MNLSTLAPTVNRPNPQQTLTHLYLGSYMGYMATNCKKSCGKCGGSKPAPTPTGDGDGDGDGDCDGGGGGDGIDVLNAAEGLLGMGRPGERIDIHGYATGNHSDEYVDMTAVARRILGTRRSEEEIRETEARLASSRLIDGRPYPPFKFGRRNNEQCYAMDRPVGERHTTKLQTYFPAKLQVVLCKNNEPYMALITWDDYGPEREALQIVKWNDINFEDELGRGKRKRTKTDAYKPESGKKSKTKPKRKKRGKKMQEIVDLLNEDDDDKSRAEISDKFREIVTNVDYD